MNKNYWVLMVLSGVMVTLASCSPDMKRKAVEEETQSAAESVTVREALAAHDAYAWLDNFQDAQSQARERKLPLMAFFTGSDWCGWCKKLEKEVLSQGEFQEHASKNYVLFKADFPRRTKLDQAVAKQNQELAKSFGVRGFPTLIIMDADGKVLATTGYRPGGAKQYVEHLKEITP